MGIQEVEMAGILYLVATPIGNLEDMTFRAVRVLKEVDLIAAEDTRNSIKLLNHFEIQTPMTSYHEFNKYEKGKKLVEKLLDGMNIAVITDAGTPGISDPGEELVKMCYEAGVRVSSVPGPAACVTALTMSGLGTRRFAFEAFLPPDKKEREAVLTELETETRTIVMYEAPHRLVKTLKLLAERLGENKKAILHIYRSEDKEIIAKYLRELAEYIITQYAGKDSDLAQIPENDKKLLIHYEKCVIVGMLLDWMDQGMKYDLVEYARRLNAILKEHGMW